MEGERLAPPAGASPRLLCCAEATRLVQYVLLVKKTIKQLSRPFLPGVISTKMVIALVVSTL